jgi:hypothetical protein
LETAVASFASGCELSLFLEEVSERSIKEELSKIPLPERGLSLLSD